MPRLRTIESRLEHYSIPEPMSGCWLWTGALNTQRGYGLISVGNGQAYAHRVSYEFHRGKIPAGMHVLHRCDNPFCINPDHLYLGTHQDNMRDVRIRGRGKGKHDHQRGEGRPTAKLSNKDVLAIRNDLDTYKTIAAKYGVCVATIGHIKSGRNWKHV